MRKIKLFIVHDRYIDYDESMTVLSYGISDWDEVSEEDFELIRSNLHLIRPSNYQTVVIVEEQNSSAIQECIKDISATIKKQIKAEADRKLEAERKRLEAKERKEAKKLEKNRETLARLIKDNPDLVKQVIKD